MMQRALLLIIIATLPQVTFADVWDPWPDQRVVSDNGEYYVVMCRAGRPIVFLDEWAPVMYYIAKRGKNTPPVKPAKSTIIELEMMENWKCPYKLMPEPNVCSRYDDTILGDGILKRPPRVIIVSSDGLGFAGLGVYGYNDYGASEFDKRTGKYIPIESDYAVILVSSCGKVLHRILFHDLLTKDEQGLFLYSAGGIHWHNAQVPGWFIESKKQLVVVGVSNVYEPDPLFFIRYIDWQTGKITKGPTLKTQKDVKKFKQESRNDGN